MKMNATLKKKEYGDNLLPPKEIQNQIKTRAHGYTEHF